MKYLINFIILLSFLFCDNKSSLIKNLYYNTVWNKYDVNEKEQEIFVGSSIANNIEYTYTVSATYGDGTESDPSSSV